MQHGDRVLDHRAKSENAFRRGPARREEERAADGGRYASRHHTDRCDLFACRAATVASVVNPPEQRPSVPAATAHLRSAQPSSTARMARSRSRLKKAAFSGPSAHFHGTAFHGRNGLKTENEGPRSQNLKVSQHLARCTLPSRQGISIERGARYPEQPFSEHCRFHWVWYIRIGRCW